VPPIPAAPVPIARGRGGALRSPAAAAAAAHGRPACPPCAAPYVPRRRRGRRFPSSCKRVCLHGPRNVRWAGNAAATSALSAASTSWGVRWGGRADVSTARWAVCRIMPSGGRRRWGGARPPAAATTPAIAAADAAAAASAAAVAAAATAATASRTT